MTKQYIGMATISFDIDAYDLDDLRIRIKDRLKRDLILEDVEVEEIHTEGEGYYDYEDIFHEEELLGEHKR